MGIDGSPWGEGHAGVYALGHEYGEEFEGAAITPATVEEALRWSARVMNLALDGRTGPSSRTTSAWPSMVRDSFIDVPEPERKARSVPSADRVSIAQRIDAWVGYEWNPTSRRVLRLRSITRPGRDKPLITWGGIARAIGCDPRSAKRWHRIALKHLVEGLIGRRECRSFVNVISDEKMSRIREVIAA